MRATFQTTPTSFDSMTLESDDFDRLGIPIDEFRPPVIRRAATRNAKSIARRLMLRDDDLSISQLSQLSLATYRLLDPRRRVNDVARAHVGRILPQAISASNPIRFLGRSAQWHEQRIAPFGGRYRKFAGKKIGHFDHGAERFKFSDVADVLSDEDLLKQSRFQRTFQRIFSLVR